MPRCALYGWHRLGAPWRHVVDYRAQYTADSHRTTVNDGSIGACCDLGRNLVIRHLRAPVFRYHPQRKANALSRNQTKDALDRNRTETAVDLFAGLD